VDYGTPPHRSALSGIVEAAVRVSRATSTPTGLKFPIVVALLLPCYTSSVLRACNIVAPQEIEVGRSLVVSGTGLPRTPRTPLAGQCFFPTSRVCDADTRRCWPGAETWQKLCGLAQKNRSRASSPFQGRACGPGFPTGCGCASVSCADHTGHTATAIKYSLTPRHGDIQDQAVCALAAPTHQIEGAKHPPRRPSSSRNNFRL